jgi:WD40 repeat protein
MNTRIFACGCWDGKIKIYEINMNNQLVQKLQFQESDPVLCLTWNVNCQQLFAGLASGQIKSFDMQGNQ